MQTESEFIKDFIENSQEYLYKVELGLLELENGNYDVLNELLRCIVSLRANAEMHSIKKIQETAFYLEKNLRKIRDYNLSVDIELVTLLLKISDILAIQLTHLQEPYTFIESDIFQIESRVLIIWEIIAS